MSPTFSIENSTAIVWPLPPLPSLALADSVQQIDPRCQQVAILKELDRTAGADRPWRSSYAEG